MNTRHHFSNDKWYQVNNNNNGNLAQASRGYKGFICMYIGIIRVAVRNDAIEDA
jgi:hypothetical protein